MRNLFLHEGESIFKILTFLSSLKWLYFFLYQKNFLFFSQNTTNSAPLEIASIPNEPVPANISRHIDPLYPSLTN